MSFQSYETKDAVRTLQFIDYLNAMGDHRHPVSREHFFAQQASDSNQMQKIALAFVSNESGEMVRKFETLNFQVYSIKSEYAERAFAGFIAAELIEVYKLIAEKSETWVGASGSVSIENLENYGWRAIFRTETTEMAKKLAKACHQVAANLKTSSFAYESLFLKKAFELIKTDNLHGLRNLCDAYDLALTYHLKNHRFNATKAYAANEINSNPETIYSFRQTPYQILSALNQATKPEHLEALTAVYIVDMGDLLCTVQNTMSAICGRSNFSYHFNAARIELV